jgi:hypothetical protein
VRAAGGLVGLADGSLLVDHDELVMLLVPFAFGDMERLQRDL